MLDSNIIAKNYNGKIEVDGINLYDPSVNQFNLYILASANSEVYTKLGYTEEQMKDRFLMFPFQCGVRFFGDYQILNMRDCLGSVSIDDIIKASRGEL